MGRILKERLKQERFNSPRVEAVLNLYLAANHMRKFSEQVCSDFGISHQQYNILRILRGAHPDGLRCADIRDRMLDRAPDITRRLDSLVEMGLVERERSDDDRRAVISKITKKGLDLLKRMDEPITGLEDILADRLTLKECKQLSDLLEKIYEQDTVAT